MRTYAAYWNNPTRIKSSSGAIFSLLSQQFDIIYGVIMEDDCYSARYARIENNNIELLRGSKYLQAKLNNTFHEVKSDISKGYRVLFSGTGCQVNGLRCYLGREYDNLFCLDVICHGVSSPKLWRKYIEYREDRYGKIKAVNFRYKNAGKKDCEKHKNQVFISRYEDPYMRMFLGNYSLRPSCYKCHAKYYKLSDMTVGDFWGIEDLNPEIDDGLGISIVITRSDKGDYYFDKICDDLIWKEVEYEKGIKKNPSEYISAKRPDCRNVFFEDMNTLSFSRLAKKYVKSTHIEVIKKRFKRVLNKGSVETQNKENYGLAFDLDITGSKK